MQLVQGIENNTSNSNSDTATGEINLKPQTLLTGPQGTAIALFLLTYRDNTDMDMPASATALPRKLTKSRFKVGVDCPTKLYYSGFKQYPNTQANDSFLSALADGGYQVGELAKQYYPGGVDIHTLNPDEATKQTSELLQNDNVILFEPAIEHDNLLVRIDILVKTGQHFDLYEVKAKSIDPSNASFMKANDKGPKGEWESYLMDVAFQQHVLNLSFPDHTIATHLMLVDKTTPAATDGLNSRFKIVKLGNSRRSIEVDASITKEDLATPILCAINVDEPVKWIQEQGDYDNRNFNELIAHLNHQAETGNRTQGKLGKRCRSCEFTATEEQRQNGLLSGYRECWEKELNWTDADFQQPTVFDIWNLRSADKLMANNKLALSTLTEEDIPKKTSDNGLSASERQWLQIEKTLDNNNEPYLDREGLLSEMETWRFPLHFIDFETIAPAIPFTRGVHPYETIAFQFSHHVLYENGQVKHIGEFLDVTPGINPSLEFIRALKNQLEVDNGTVFRFHNHENTVLNGLICQLQSNVLTDQAEANELIEFNKDLTHSNNGNTESWIGSRDMVDLHQLNLKYYYNPLTGGANSLKALLPAVLQSSAYLQTKYGESNYGSDNGIPSLNFTDKQWVVKNNGTIQDPYASLPPLFASTDETQNGLTSEADRIADGGAAMTAYAMLQNVTLNESERDALMHGLLRYCELDTLAMVMVVEGWRDVLGIANSSP